jgi:tetratricopeptide (TPR) repeat protein
MVKGGEVTSDSQPVNTAVTLHDAALSALHDGRLGDARRLSTEAIEAAQAAFGPDSADLANVLLTAATVEQAAGDFRAALTLAERAARVAAPLIDTDEADLMSLWVDIEVECGHLLATLGEFDRAETRLAATLSAATRVLPPDDIAVVSIHNVRGITGKFAGRFDDAEGHYMRVRAAIEAQPDIDERALATLLHNLGGLDHSRGRLADGLAHAQEGLELRIKAVGPDSPDVARDLNAIGALHHDAGDAAAADAAYRQALDIFERELGSDHYEVGMTCANLAVSTAAAADAPEAARLYERALTILESRLGADHPDVALVQHSLARLLAEQGDLDGARDLLMRAKTSLTSSLPEDHPRVIDLAATIEDLSSRSSEL